MKMTRLFHAHFFKKKVECHYVFPRKWKGSYESFFYAKHSQEHFDAIPSSKVNDHFDEAF